jgi:PAS domain S-box-containing protein
MKESGDKDDNQLQKVNEKSPKDSKYTRSLIEANLDPLVTISSEGKITDVNEATIKVTGVPRDKIIGTDFSYYFTDPERAQAGYLQVFKDGIVRDYELEIENVNGDITPVLYNASVYRDDEGEVTGVFAAARDITKLKRTENELRLSNLYNRELLETSIDPLVTIGSHGKIMDVNDAVELVTGYSRDQVIGTDFSDYFTEPEKAQAGYKEVFSRGFVKDYPLEIRHKDGHVTPVLYNASVYHDENDEVIGVFAAARDITHLKKAEEQLQEHLDNLEITVKKRTVELTNVNVLLKAEIKERKRMEENIQDNVKRLNLALESANMGAWDLDLINDTAIRTLEHDQIFGYDSLLPEWSAKIFFEHIIPEDREHVQQKFEKAYQTNKLFFQCRITRADNKQIRWIEAYGNVYRDKEDVPIRMLGVILDITERKKTEDQLLKVVSEKEALLREIHHRVKNNMQIISSLLRLESSQVFDERDAELFTKVQDRVKSMGLIHGNLYQSEDLSCLNFKEYLYNLTNELFATHNASSNIKLITDVIDVTLNMETAIPLGLIVNELVSNSLEHAFPDFKGEISISIQSKGEEIELIIKDNGVGLPKEIDLTKTEHLGLELVNSLVNQIEGKIELDRSDGTDFKITFKELEYKERL